LRAAQRGANGPLKLAPGLCAVGVDGSGTLAVPRAVATIATIGDTDCYIRRAGNSVDRER
jgi:hypothetical protein